MNPTFEDRLLEMLNGIEPAERPVGATCPGRKSPLQTTTMAARIPTELYNQIKALKGTLSSHIERALIFYVKTMAIRDSVKPCPVCGATTHVEDNQASQKCVGVAPELTEDDTKDIVRNIIKEEVALVVTGLLQPKTVIPPEPVREEGGRAFTSKRVKIAGTTDHVLLELFEKERKKKNLSASRMIDTILWNHFGKPQLSFEQGSDRRMK
jgi:hypothetical protein